MSDVLAVQMPEGYQRHVFNIFVNLPEGLAPVNANNRIFATTDYFPTILAAMGVEISGDRLGLGTNLFSDRQTLLEEMGEDAYNTEVLRYSDYYFNNFV
jgi:phosphoglycerol transferase